jgi:hypothetical protein
MRIPVFEDCSGRFPYIVDCNVDPLREKEDV